MRSNAHRLPALCLAFALGVVGALPAHADETVTLTHVHGLSYSADGARLTIPSHHGLAVFEAGRWSKAAGPAHDYMGYSAARDALYSSGHPAPESGEINPFGLIKSSDGGKTWRKLGLQGESDFHVLATSYRTNAVYVFNHAANSRMSQAGIYHTTNDGLRWTHAKAAGLGGELRSLAVHPTDPRVVAAGTADDLYLSRDAAASFRRLAGDGQVLATAFAPDGRHLWFSGYAGAASLKRIALEAGASPQALPLPSLGEDAVVYIAHNPVRRKEIAIATFKRSVLLSQDEGRSWAAIARGGATVNERRGRSTP